MPASESERTRQEPTPQELGFSMPPEWARHQATWISWPHNRESWPGRFKSVEPLMVQAVAALESGETVRINVNDPDHEAHVRSLLEQAGAGRNVIFHHFPTNDAWCRDHGAVFVKREIGGHSELAAIDFRYNAWGGKYPPWDLDDQIPGQMADALGIPLFSADFVLEGGSIDVNGSGMLLTTESCLLNPNRNPDLSRQDIEGRLGEYVGVDRILWLGDGIAGDDTDGHIDDITRFVSESAVVTVVEENPDDVNFEPLAANRERLENVRTANGHRLHIIPLPMPDPIYIEGQRLPASYANFYIGNEVILLPVFGDPRDEEAVDTLDWLFPDRRVVSIDCRDLVWGLGAFHCLTQQVPALDATNTSILKSDRRRPDSTS